MAQADACASRQVLRNRPKQDEGHLGVAADDSDACRLPELPASASGECPTDHLI